MDVRIKWDRAALSKHMKESSGIANELMRLGEKYASLNNAEAQMRLHSPMKTPLYVYEHRTLDDTQAVVVHSHNKAGAGIGRKYGLPHY